MKLVDWIDERLPWVGTAIAFVALWLLIIHGTVLTITFFAGGILYFNGASAFAFAWKTTVISLVFSSLGWIRYKEKDDAMFVYFMVGAIAGLVLFILLLLTLIGELILPSLVFLPIKFETWNSAAIYGGICILVALIGARLSYLNWKKFHIV